MEKNIMLAFVSPVNQNSLQAPIVYQIHGENYTAIQTNESAIVYVERMLGADSIARIFLIASSFVRNGKIPTVKIEKPPPVVEPTLVEFLKRWVSRKFSKPKKLPPAVVENPPPAVTHLEFLKNRIAAEFPHLADRFTELDYSDASDSLEKNILQIAEIADAVTAYAQNFPDDKIIVHADMTGGFRHASMLMLSIIQLLSYRGIETGKILYSDPAGKIVYEANEIQRVSLLITGADEFVKFGSVNALLEYFGANSAAATSLLHAMNNFSDAIKICRTATIQDDLKNLGEQIQKFRATASKDLKSELFAKIIDRIEAEYGGLIRGGAGHFEIIRWCMDKGFWQQAMTLCTEWLPEELVDRKIFMPGNAAIVEDAEADGKAFGRGWKQQFIISYTNTKPPEIPADAPTAADVNNFCKNLRTVLEMCRISDPAKTVGRDYYGELINFMRDYKNGYNSFRACLDKKLKVKKFQADFPYLAKAIQAILDERSKNPTCRKTFFELMQQISYDGIINLLGRLTNDFLLEAFSVDKMKIPRETVAIIAEDKPRNRWDNRRKIYADMLKNKAALSELDDVQRVLDLLHGFYELRRKRNEINHAVGLAEIAELKTMIEKYLDQLEKI